MRYIFIFRTEYQFLKIFNYRNKTLPFIHTINFSHLEKCLNYIFIQFLLNIQYQKSIFFHLPLKFHSRLSIFHLKHPRHNYIKSPSVRVSIETITRPNEP